MDRTPATSAPAIGGLAQLRAPEGTSALAFLVRAVPAPGEERERLLSFLVHEIRNPLASTLWSVEMLARKSLGDPRSDRLANLAARSARRLRVLLEDVFALERFPPPERQNPARIDVREAVGRALAPHDLEPEGVHAEVVEGPVGLATWADPILLDRLLHAAVRRAVHAGEGGLIRVRLAAEAEGPRVSIVRVGLTAEQLDPPLLAPGGSEGAGTTFTLFLARLGAERMGVRMWVEPHEDGAAIELVLPPAVAPPR